MNKNHIILKSVLALSLLLIAIGPGTDSGSAQPIPPRHQADIAASKPFVNDHEKLTLGLHKSRLIELPEDVAEIVISNPEVVDAVVRTKRRVHLLGQQVGQATATFLSRDGEQLLTLEVSVERDLTQLQDMIRRLIPGANIQLESMNNNIVVTGSVANPIDATRIADIAGRFVADRNQVLNMVNVDAKEQVLLRVSVMEMNRSSIKRLGVDVQAALASGNFAAIKLAESALPVTSGIITGATIDKVTGLLSTGGSGDTLAIGGGNGKGQIAAILQALERNGLARVLAEPNLTATSGETADFLAGGEYPVPIDNDRNGTTVTFKKFGISLAFTPIVLSEGRISIKIATEVSELTSDGAVTLNEISIPALRVRRASSTLELPSGGSLVMAGLISTSTRQSVDGLPGLRELPVLGALFRSDDFIRSESELVVIVTPILVQPVAHGVLQQPDQPVKWETIFQDASLPASEAKNLADDWERLRIRKDLGFIVE